MDTHRRTILKTISWRVVATLITGVVAFVVTGRVDMAITVGLGDSLGIPDLTIDPVSSSSR
jgi:hypothetical protein